MASARKLFGLLKPFRAQMGLSVLASFLASLLDVFTLVLLIPLLRTLFGTAGALDAATPTRLESFVDWVSAPLVAGVTPAMAAVRILVLFFLAVVLKNVLTYVAAYTRVLIEEGMVRDLRVRLFGHILRLDLSYFQSTKQGQVIASVLSDVEETKTIVSATMARLVQNSFVILVSLIALTQISLRLTLLTLALAPVLILGIGVLLRRLRYHARGRADERGEVTATIAERVGAIKLIRAYGEEDREIGQFHQQSQRYRKLVIRTQRFLLAMSPVSELFGVLVLVLLILAGTRPEILGISLSPEAIVVFLVAALRMMSPIKSIAQYPAAVSIAAASADRVFELLDRPQTDVDLPEERPATFTREISYDHVTFAYDGTTEVLRDICFTIPRGNVTAIVGPSGAGKTTLVDLIPRFQEPQSGAVLFDDEPLTNLTRSSIRKLLGVVSQETVLLNDTVYANILIGRQEASRNEVELAARAANAHDFISGLPKGYHTRLGERGTRLSGGQRQRIAIARALLRDPPILILDEATSALDTESEHQVQGAIERLMQDRTVLVIAHRLSTVRNADDILVLDNGRLVEHGTHETLYALHGMYRKLYDLQFRAPEAAGSATPPEPVVAQPSMASKGEDPARA
ncbi:MAG: ABC transporter ATP-binding protein [Gemmatimonadales bacterium]